MIASLECTLNSLKQILPLTLMRGFVNLKLCSMYMRAMSIDPIITDR